MLQPLKGACVFQQLNKEQELRIPGLDSIQAGSVMDVGDGRDC